MDSLSRARGQTSSTQALLSHFLSALSLETLVITSLIGLMKHTKKKKTTTTRFDLQRKMNRQR